MKHTKATHRPMRRSLAIACTLLLAAGCAEEGLDVRYGSRQPILGGDTSVNGTGVLAEMFRRGGHEIGSITRLTPRAGRAADVIIWMPNDLTPPSQAAVEWLENWLAEDPHHTLVYVMPDYDAAPHYWAKVKGKASEAQLPTIDSLQRQAVAEFEHVRAGATAEGWNWFVYDPTLSRKTVHSLSGDPNWTDGVDPAKVEIELYGRIKLHPPDEESALRDEVLLESNGDVLVFRRPMFTYDFVHDSQLIVVVNGSFLLNLPLVNREHRKLAASLIREVGMPERTVLFLESGGDVEVLDEDPPPPKMMTSTMYFEVPRIQVLLWHLSVLALIVCFALASIFGRPREDSLAHQSDFGRHVDALGELLARTGDTQYARSRLAHYQQMIRG